VETDYDTDSDGKLDLIKAVVQLPRAAMEGVYDAAVIYEARPYCAGTQSRVIDRGSDTYDIDQLYSTAEPRVPAGTASTEELVDAAQAADFYFYENLDWYDYFLVRGFAVVVSAGPGTKGSEGFETCGSDLEIDAFACVIEWLTGNRVAYTDKTGNIAIEADWCNGQVGMTGRSYAGTTQFGLATTGVAGLETIVPVAGIASWYEYSCSQGMNLRGDAYTNNLAYYCASRALDGTDWPTISTAYWNYLGQLDADEEALNGSYGKDDQLWAIRDYTRNAANIKCPALIVHGLNDSNVRPKNSYLMYDCYLTAGADVKLLLHQDGHVTPAYGAKKVEQLIDGEPYQDVLNRWFSYYLYDIDNGADEMAPVTIQSNVDGTWSTCESWGSEETMTIGFEPNATIANYGSSSGISSGNCVATYTAGNTAYSTVTVIDVTEDITINGVIEVTVTATPQLSGNNQMLTAWLVDLSDTAFKAYNITSSGYQDNRHSDTKKVIDIGGGAESYKLVELIPETVTAKIIASGWMDLANPEAGLYSHTAVGNGKSVVEEQTYTIYLNPTIYTVKEGHQLALVICTRDPQLSSYRNNADGYSVLISDVEAVIPVN
jgi:X-Pro dipeptidyl-peptidase